MLWKGVSVALFLALVSLGVYTFWPDVASVPVVQTLTNTVSSVLPSDDPSTAPIAASPTDKITTFGTMLAFQSGQGIMGDKAMEAALWDGWSDFRTGEYWQKFYSNLQKSFERKIAMVKQTEFSSDRDVVGAFAWNVIQPEKDGAYDWTMPDLVLTSAGKAGITVSAVVYPYGSWQTSEQTDPKKCQGIDFAFFDGHIGYPTDTEAYKTFLTAMVERYDGDGVNDMPGLSTRVEAWEVGNEVEGMCSNSKAADYVDFLKVSSETIKAADATALVANAGAMEIIGQTGKIQTTINFWQSFFDLGAAQYLDVFTLHYNAERADVRTNTNAFTENVKFFHDELASHDAADMPMWLTEFGLPTSAAYTEYVGVAEGLGVKRFFIDLEGSDEGNIGPSCLFKSPSQPREFLQTLQVLGVK